MTALLAAGAERRAGPEAAGSTPAGSTVSFVDGGSGLWPSRSEDYTSRGADLAIRAVSRGALAEPAAYDAQPDALITVAVRWDDGQRNDFVFRATTGGHTARLLNTGADGVTGIVSHRIVDGLAEITVTTAAGGVETRRYPWHGRAFIRVP